MLCALGFEDAEPGLASASGALAPERLAGAQELVGSLDVALVARLLGAA